MPSKTKDVHRANGASSNDRRISASSAGEESIDGEDRDDLHGDADSDPEASKTGSKGKPVLTEAERKANHIKSEKQRRDKNRIEMERMAVIVGLPGEGRSEGKVLAAAAVMARRVVAEREELIRRIEAAGGIVPEEYRNFDTVTPKAEIPSDKEKLLSMQ